MRRRLAVSAGVGLILSSGPGALAVDRGVEVLLLPLRDSAKEDRIVRRVPTSCGPLALAKVDSMPFARDQRLGAPAAYALSADGAVVMQWPVPADAIPRATSGSTLTVATHLGLVAIRADRAVARADASPPLRDAVPRPCPDGWRDSGRVGYSCIAVPVVGTVADQVLVAYQPACTVR